MAISVNNLSVNDILKITRRAQHDAVALKELHTLNERVANAVNRRISTFQKHHTESPALSILYNYTRKQRGFKSGKISKSKKQSIEQLKQNLLKSVRFLGSDTGTYRGYKKYMTRSITALEERYGIKLDGKEREMFTEFTRTEFFKYLKDFDSDRILKDFLSFSKKDVTVDEIEKSWNAFRNNRRRSILDELDALEKKYSR